MPPILIMHVAWMRRYRGEEDDVPKGHFGYMENHGALVHETFNFLETNDTCYGYAPANNRVINLTRLGGTKDDKYLDGILVVWTATRPGGKRVVVGWYKNARVFAQMQKRPPSRKIPSEFGQISYNASAKYDNCILLTEDQRTFEVVAHKKGYPGTSSSFYGDEHADQGFIDSLRKYIDSSGASKRASNARRKTAPDAAHNKNVEKSAVEAVWRYYEDLGYDLISKENERPGPGYDLEAKKDDVTLYLEVKGVSGSDAVAEVTPNEYRAMNSRELQPFYRICIVTNALQVDSKLRSFYFDKRINRWITEEDELLLVCERPGARLSLDKS